MGRQYLRATSNVQEKEKRGGNILRKKSAQENRTCTKDHELLLHKKPEPRIAK